MSGGQRWTGVGGQLESSPRSDVLYVIDTRKLSSGPWDLLLREDGH